MTKLFLSKDIDAELSYINQVKQKNQILQVAYDLCIKHITIDDMDAFKESFLGYTENQIRERVNLKGVTAEKIFELYDIPMMQIRKHESDFKRINVDVDAPIPSFDIYADTKEEIEKAKQSQRLCDLLNEMQVKTDWILIQRVFAHSIRFMHDAWVINPSAIKTIH
jgi:hypothetical protein